MKTTMTLLGLLILAGLSISSCNEAPAVAERNSTEAPVPSSFFDGVNAQNKGSKNGTITLSGTLSHKAWTKMYLYSTYGRTNTKIDSSDIREGAFRFRPQSLDMGFYMLGPAENNLVPVILNPSEPEVTLVVRGMRMDGSCGAVKSPENLGWFTYYPQENSLLKQIRDARASARKSTVSAEYEKQAALKESELLALQGQMINDNPGTYFAKILTWKQEPQKTDKTKYWDNIDFTDESLIHSLVLSDRIQNFMRSFSRGEESGFIDCIAQIADKAKVNDVVLEFALNQMLVGFYESGMETICTYIIDNYIHGDACGDANLSNIIQGTAESIVRLSVGKTPPNLFGKGFDGKNVDLNKLRVQNNYTLVLFWSSWCEHCQGEAIEVVSCYNQWHSKGFEILGYSVDNNEAAWRTALTERSFTFPNICGYNTWDSKGAKDYRITKTPGYFVLDKDGMIVLKPKSIREVQTFLKSNL